MKPQIKIDNDLIEAYKKALKNVTNNTDAKHLQNQLNYYTKLLNLNQNVQQTARKPS